MRRTIWIPVVVAALLSIYVALGKPASESRIVQLAVGSRIVPMRADPVDDGRVHLTPAQLSEARASNTWPRQLNSLLEVERPLNYGDFVWNDRGVPRGPITVRVDLDAQVISVFRSGHEIGTAVVLYGADSHKTPIGRFPILQKLRDHTSRTYGAPMPYTLRLTSDGIAIHGSDVRWGAATHGCVGVPLEFASRLFDAAEPGDEVIIVKSAEAPIDT